jgi:hypothetical protein
MLLNNHSNLAHGVFRHSKRLNPRPTADTVTVDPNGTTGVHADRMKLDPTVGLNVPRDFQQIRGVRLEGFEPPTQGLKIHP